MNQKEMRKHNQEKIATEIAEKQGKLIALCIYEALGRDFDIEEVSDRLTREYQKALNGATYHYYLDGKDLVTFHLFASEKAVGGVLGLELTYESPYLTNNTVH